MFTGIVQEVGVVGALERDGELARLTVKAAVVLRGVKPGDSIAVDGVCLTVVLHDAAGFTVEAVPATLERTTLGALRSGDRVNLERALGAGDALGGHIVQGHVDGVGTIRRVERSPDAVQVDVAVPGDVFGVTVLRGSITLDGVSLTVAGLPESGMVRVSLIPFTLEHTTLGAWREGDSLNVEADLIAKLVAEQTRRWLETRAGDGALGVDAGLGPARGVHGIR